MPALAKRNTFDRALRIAGYNWPLYAGAAIAIVVGVTLLCAPGVPRSLRWVGGLGAAIAGWYAVASFSAFHWMFDRSQLLDGMWLRKLSSEPRRCIQINAGLEETTLPLSDIFPDAELKTFDLYDPTVMTEPALTRARQRKSDAMTTAVQPGSLPVDSGWADFVVVTLAAHEIRNGLHREQFFRDLRRVVSPAGKVVVVEHLRDFVAALAFGPGMFHFFRRSEWLSLGSRVGLDVERELPITPFIRVFVYRPETQRCAPA
jgi:hypothetical protein